MNRRTPVFSLTLRCLLSVWLGFGCLELAGQFNLVPEASAEDQAEQDLDRDALSQMASGLKPEGPSLDDAEADAKTEHEGHEFAGLSVSQQDEIRKAFIGDKLKELSGLVRMRNLVECAA